MARLIASIVKIMKTHNCTQNQIADFGVKIIYGPELESGWQSWILQNIRFAGAKDVQDGEAESIGEVLSHNEIAINFCPFCGIELNNEL